MWLGLSIVLFISTIISNLIVFYFLLLRRPAEKRQKAVIKITFRSYLVQATVWLLLILFPYSGMSFIVHFDIDMMKNLLFVLIFLAILVNCVPLFVVRLEQNVFKIANRSYGPLRLFVRANGWSILFTIALLLVYISINQLLGIEQMY